MRAFLLVAFWLLFAVVLGLTVVTTWVAVQQLLGPRVEVYDEGDEDYGPAAP